MVPTGDGYDDLYFLVVYSNMSLTSGFTRKTSYDVLVAVLHNTYAHDDWNKHQTTTSSFTSLTLFYVSKNLHLLFLHEYFYKSICYSSFVVIREYNPLL